MTICFYTTVTQDASVYQNIGVTWNFNWDVIVDITDDVFIIWPVLASIISSPPSKTVGVISVC